MTASPKRVRRTYKGADAQMLTSCLVQVDNLIPIQNNLVARRSKITSAYLADTRQLVADALEQDLGIDPHTAVQLLTGQLTSAQDKTLGLFRSFNLDLRDAFAEIADKTRLREITATLGFRDHYATAQRGQQQALSELLAKFVTATDDAPFRAELEDRYDISPALIDDIRDQKDFYKLDAAQEQGKSTAPTITDDTIRRFNLIYRRVQAVARLARDLFKSDAARADQFSYSLIRRRMTGGPSPDAPPQP